MYAGDTQRQELPGLCCPWLGYIDAGDDSGNDGVLGLDLKVRER